MKIKKMILTFLSIIGILSVLAGSFFIAFFLTAFIYKLIKIHPPALLIQLINSFLGLFFAVFIIFIILKYIEPQNSGVFEGIIKAIENIARGDFSVRLEDDTNGKGPLGELVKSVNSMAVELSQMEKMRQEFISNVSHEIQSPLTSIRGFAQALQNENINAEDRSRYLKIIEAESIRLSKLSDNLLKLASLDAETVKPEPRLYRLDKQIRSIILTCEPQWVEKNIDMKVHLEEVNINADEDMLSQVWINLIYNSIKFTPAGGKVRIDLCQRCEKIEFKISDTGIGISEEEQLQIFDRFYKADKSRQYSNKGSGLGLSIVRKIIDMHKGTISVESKLQVGTMFTVYLPIK